MPRKLARANPEYAAKFDRYEAQGDADPAPRRGDGPIAAKTLAPPSAHSPFSSAGECDARLNQVGTHLVCGACANRLGEWVEETLPTTDELMREVRLPEGVSYDVTLDAFRMSRGARERMGAANDRSWWRYRAGAPIRRLSPQHVKTGRILLGYANIVAWLHQVSSGAIPAPGKVERVHEHVAAPASIICYHCGRRNALRLDTGR